MSKLAMTGVVGVASSAIYAVHPVANTVSIRALELLPDFAELDSGERERRLATLREAQPSLADELESLLAFDEAPSPLSREDFNPLSPAAGMSPDLSLQARQRVGQMLGRWRLSAYLGSGGNGSVYQAEAEEGGAPVALKLLTGHSDSRRHLRFRREFRAVARLNHPGCLRVFEEGEHEGQPFYVMELAAHGDLHSLEKAAPVVIVDVLQQIAVALDYIHGERIIHRDLKPENVLLAETSPPQIKLADFGIAQLGFESRAALTESGAVLGTLDYLSPEQVMGQPADPRSDLYALGCIAHRLVTGVAPFSGNPFQRLVLRVRSAPPPLRELVAGLPEDLSALVDELLQPEPAARPASAQTVARRLDAIGVELGGRARGGDLRSGGAAFVYRPGLLGRESTLAALRGQLESGPAPRIAAVIAPAGAGKTHVLTAFTRVADAVGHRSLMVSTYAGATLPLAPFPLVESALGASGAVDEAPGDAADDVAYDATSHRRRRAAALAQALVTAGGARRFVLILDDLHLASASALAFLGELHRALEALDSPAPRPTILLGLRSEKGEAALEVLRAADVPVARITLPALDRRARGAVAAAMLGTQPGALPERLLDALDTLGADTPLTIRNQLQTLSVRGALEEGPDGWTLRRLPEAPDAEAPSALSARLAQLPDEVPALLEAAAIVPRRFDLPLLAALMRRPEEALLDALDAALRAELLRPASGEDSLECFTFDHRRVAEQIYEAIPASRRQQLHARAGHFLLEHRRPASAELAQHFVAAGERALAYRHLRAAAEAATAANDFEAARRFWESALDHAAPHERDESLEALCDVLSSLGLAREAGGHLRGLVARAQSREVRARRLRKLGHSALWSGTAAEAVDHLAAALRELGELLPVGRWRRRFEILRQLIAVLSPIQASAAEADEATLVQRALVHRELATLHRWVNLEQVLFHTVRFARVIARTDAHSLRAESTSMLTMALTLLGLPGAARYLGARERRAAQPGADLRLRALQDLFSSTQRILIHNDIPGSLSLADRSLAHAELLGDRALISQAFVGRAWCRVFAGHYNAAARDFDDAHGLARDLGQGWQEADALAARSITLVILGRFDEARDNADRVLSRSERLGMPALTGVATETHAAIALLEGRYAQSREGYDRARAIYRRHDLRRSWGILMPFARGEACLWHHDYEGRAALPGLVSELRTELRDLKRNTARLLVFRDFTRVLAATLHSRRGHHRRALRLFRQAERAQPKHAEQPFALWMSLRTTTELQRLGAISRREAARRYDSLDDDFGRFDMLGAQRWLRAMRQDFGL